MNIHQVDVIKKEGVLYGFRLNKAVVYSIGNTIQEAFLNAWKSLEYENQFETPSITSEDETIELYIPQPSKVTSLELYSNYRTVILKEPVTVSFIAEAYDQYGQELEVSYEKFAVINTVGVHEFTATCGELSKTIEITAIEYKESEEEEVEEIPIEDILLEQEERITVLEIGGM